MEKAGLIIMQTTLNDRGQAETLAEHVVHARLAACAQVLGPISSFYHWQDAMCKEREYLVVMKTMADKQAALARHICERHPYTAPELIAMPVSCLSPAYLDWLTQSCSR